MNSAQMERCENCSIERSFPRVENAAYAVPSSRITAISCRTISARVAWEAPGETITRTIFRPFTIGAIARRDRPGCDQRATMRSSEVSRIDSGAKSMPGNPAWSLRIWCSRGLECEMRDLLSAFGTLVAHEPTRKMAKLAIGHCGAADAGSAHLRISDHPPPVL